MSKRFERQYTTGQGVAADRYYGITREESVTTPTNGASGYAPGCLWQNMAGSAGSVLYVNIGTNTSATWLNIG